MSGSIQTPGLMILGAGKWREAVKDHHIDRQFVLDDLDIPPDAFRRVVRKAEDVVGIDDDPGPFPRQVSLQPLGVSGEQESSPTVP